MICDVVQQVLVSTGHRRLVIATSGGPDSQALLHALAALRPLLQLELWAVGVDHGLRPEASGELDLARALAAQLDVPFVRREVVLAPGNVMAEARRARYAALEHERQRVHAEAIALAHTASDQAETLLMRLARGTSLKGAGAMAMYTGALLRPLLDVTREQIIAYVREHALPHALDPSNQNPRFTRARVRAEVLAPLSDISPGAVQHLAQFARWAQQDEALLQQLAQEQLSRALGAAGGLCCAQVAAMPEALQRRVLSLWLERHDIPVRQRHLATLQDALAQPDWRGSFMRRSARVEAGHLWLEAPLQATSWPLPITGRVELPGGGWFVEAGVTELPNELPAGLDPGRNAMGRAGVAFDLDRLHLELRICTWRPGDQLQPSGMEGHIKVSSLLAQARVPRSMRRVWPLVRHGEEVLWVGGLRRGAAAPVSAGTRRVLELHLRGGAPLPRVLG